MRVLGAALRFDSVGSWGVLGTFPSEMVEPGKNLSWGAGEA